MTYLYAYYNKKIGAYMDPIPSPIPQDGFMKSVIRTCKLEKDAAIKAHLNEDDLYYVGEFDDQTGKIIIPEHPEFLCSLDALFQEEEKKDA